MKLDFCCSRSFEMKFSIRTTQTPDKASWTVALTCSNEKFKFDPRELRRCGKIDEGFPIPSVALDSWKGKTHELLCAPPDDDPSEIKRLYDNIVIGDLDAGNIERFGRYLTAVLLGDNWPKMLEAADREQIELELYFDCKDAELTRLPWEMMYGDERPFGATSGRDVAITRIISSKREGEAGKLSLPLKVLFVIGRQLDDKLRPGAEYLGLLRRMKIEFVATQEPRSVDLNTRLLMEATTEELKAHIAEFRPHVVHFICHGVVDADGGRILLTKPREDQSSNGQLEADECNAEKLLEAMSSGKAPENLPPIVVLNACHTADADMNAASDIKGAYISLAAQLVAGGVPVAIGMAGEIADGACRIFTRNFYQALIKQEPIALATARGRRAAMYHYEEFYTTSVEWVRPTLFAADGVLESMIVDHETHEDMLKLTEIPSKYLGDRNVLCDRFAYLAAYDRFRQEVASTSEYKMLAFRVNEPEHGKQRFGKTRLLEEIAARSVLDNFIPCLIRNRGITLPTNLLSFAVLLADVMNETRARFSIQKKRIRSYALDRAFKLYNVQPVMTDDLIDFEDAKQAVKARLKNLGTEGEPKDLEPEVIKRVIVADFRQLYNDVNSIPDEPPVAGAAAQPPAPAGQPAKERRNLLLLLDDLHLYEGVAQQLLREAMTGPYGLGDDTLTVPVVFTYSSNLLSSPTGALEEIEKFVTRARYVAKEDLKRINDESEARLAYSQFLLSRETPLSFNWLGTKKADVDALLSLLHQSISGVPSLLYQDMITGILALAQFQKTLLDADDDKIMQSLKQLDEKALHK